jgi:hypothetical protein
MSKLHREGHCYDSKSKRKHEESPTCWCNPDRINLTKTKAVFMHKNGRSKSRLLTSIILDHTTGKREVL